MKYRGRRSFQFTSVRLGEGGAIGHRLARAALGWIPTCATAAIIALAGSVGCTSSFTEKAANGITFYCPGAGNIDFGDSGIREGLEAAGYKGQVATLTWTVSLNPAIDQALRINAHLGAAKLADTIAAYADEYPDKEINVIGLSAGSGIAIWALENVKKDYKVENVVLLSSSLAHDYDVSRALQHVKGKIYVYYSPHDVILAGPMKLFGTIDGKFGVDGAGAVGLHSPRNQDRVVNIPWRSSFERLGYYGGHVDSTSPQFVQAVLSKHLLHAAEPKPPEKNVAMNPAQGPVADSSDRSPPPVKR